MINELSCAIVRDLLPSYIDGLTGDETTAAVNQHLAGCKECREALRLMKDPEPLKKTNMEEIDYLKKVRHHGLSRALITGIVLMIIGISIFAFRIFYVGFKADASDIVFDVSADGSNVKLTAHTLNSGLGISRMTFSNSNGMVQVMVYTAPKMFFNSGEYTTSYDALYKVGRVRMDDIILWEEGTSISRTAAELFAEASFDKGDMSSNANIAAILGISSQFGSFTNELQTVSQPYGWTLILNDKIAISNEELSRNKMIVDSCVMLAAIDNLGYVTWRYQTDAGEQELTFTADEASTFSGYAIKSCCDSVIEFQDFLRAVGIK